MSDEPVKSEIEHEDFVNKEGCGPEITGCATGCLPLLVVKISIFSGIFVGIYLEDKAGVEGAVVWVFLIGCFLPLVLLKIFNLSKK